jgi:hypothetical protein
LPDFCPRAHQKEYVWFVICGQAADMPYQISDAAEAEELLYSLRPNSLDLRVFLGCTFEMIIQHI